MSVENIYIFQALLLQDCKESKTFFPLNKLYLGPVAVINLNYMLLAYATVRVANSSLAANFSLVLKVVIFQDQ